MGISLLIEIKPHWFLHSAASGSHLPVTSSFMQVSYSDKMIFMNMSCNRPNPFFFFLSVQHALLSSCQSLQLKREQSTHMLKGVLPDCSKPAFSWKLDIFWQFYSAYEGYSKNPCVPEEGGFIFSTWRVYLKKKKIQAFPIRTHKLSLWHFCRIPKSLLEVSNWCVSRPDYAFIFSEGFSFTIKIIPQ